MDFVARHPIPEHLREAVRAALRGEAGIWPETLGAGEVRSLMEHGVVPLVYAATRRPELRAEAIRAAALEPLREQDLREVLDALAARGIDALVIKGSALAYEAYPTPDLRPRGDTDLLVPSDVAPAVSAVMRELGFREQITSGDEHGVRQTIYRRPSGASYDIHWSATNTPLFDDMFRFDELRRRAIALPALGASARVLAPVDALLLACIHRVAHHYDSDRLIWLVDIALLRDGFSRDEHREFWELAAEAAVVTICTRSIELASQWMSRPLHDMAGDWLPEDQVRRKEPSQVYLDRAITHGGILVANLRGLSWRARLRRLWQLAFPPPAFMRQSFGERGALMLPWLYLYRAGRGVMRLFRRAVQ